MRYKRCKRNLLSRGVSKENILLLPPDNHEPVPTPIRNDLAAFEQEQLKVEQDERKRKAKEVFQSSCLKTTEKELYECMVAVETSAGPEMKASMMVLREILEDKLKNQHKNLGTLGCKEAMSERKRLCKIKTKTWLKACSRHCRCLLHPKLWKMIMKCLATDPKLHLMFHKTTLISSGHSCQARSKNFQTVQHYRQTWTTTHSQRNCVDTAVRRDKEILR